MSIQFQHILVLVIVGGAFAFVAWHALRGLRGKPSRVGSCCARGCAETLHQQQRTESPAPSDRIVFLPVEQLTRARRR